MTTFKNCYDTNRMERASARVKMFMDKIFPLLMVRNQENAINVEFASSLTYTLLEDSQRLLLPQFKKAIFDIFDSDDFFKCSMKSLNYSNWKKIVKMQVLKTNVYI